MKIGELALRSACPIETIRYYERIGLVPEPIRSAANYRDYGSAALERLRFIRNCRSLDMSHNEIRQLLQSMDQEGADCAPLGRIVAEHLAHVRRRMAELGELEQQLLELSVACHSPGGVADCAIARRLAEGCVVPPRRSCL